MSLNANKLFREETSPHKIAMPDQTDLSNPFLADGAAHSLESRLILALKSTVRSLVSSSALSVGV